MMHEKGTPEKPRSTSTIVASPNTTTAQTVSNQPSPSTEAPREEAALDRAVARANERLMKPPVPHFGKSGKKKKKKAVEDEKYTLDTPILTLREALIQDGIRQGSNKDFAIKNVDITLKKASDPDVFKGLIAYLNWQDKLRERIQTPK